VGSAGSADLDGAAIARVGRDPASSDPERRAVHTVHPVPDRSVGGAPVLSAIVDRREIDRADMRGLL